MAEPVKRLTHYDFKAMKQQGVKATSITAYDYPFAKMCDQAGIDLIICGGSVGMVCLGYETTVPVTMEPPQGRDGRSQAGAGGGAVALRVLPGER